MMKRWLFAALAALTLASPASAQSLTLTNLKAALVRTCPTMATVRTTTVFWRELAACQRTLAPVPAPTPTPIPTPTPTVALPTLAQGTFPAWGSGGLPGPYDTHTGAFRFICSGDGPLRYDDPVVYPGKSGAAHLHQVWGNRSFDANTTPETLLASASTNCNDTPFSLNRSSYWQPALIHDSGQVIRPDLVMVYYKRKTSASPYCTPGHLLFMGICTELPAKLRFIMGWDQTRPTAPFLGASWICNTVAGGRPDLDELFQAGCKPGDQLIASTVGPDCWDGKNLDSADHRSHVIYAYRDPHTSIARCPKTHPHLIAQQENKASFTVTADMIGTRADGTKFSRIGLSSDHMLPGAKPGATLHADYMEAWVAEARRAWHEGCIEKGLSCSGGDLGDGRMLLEAREPKYGWVHPAPRVPIPVKAHH